VKARKIKMKILKALRRIQRKKFKQSKTMRRRKKVMHRMRMKKGILRKAVELRVLCSELV
jgi:protein-disulfide isomerase-like protein with CxxC motif